jgi:rubrerythrin
VNKEEASRKILEEAIRFENDGRDFFLKAAERAKTYVTRLIFQTIAEEELDHIRRVKQIYENDTAFQKQDPSPLTPRKSELLNIFQEAKAQMGQTLLLNADEAEAVRVALQLEFKGHEFYDRLAQEATSDFEKAFYQHLAQEESVHFSVLRQMEEAVMNPTRLG